MTDRYFSVNKYFRQRFGVGKIRKIPLDAGLSCPNKNGYLDTKGCIFCDEFGSGPLTAPSPSVTAQVEAYIQRYPGNFFIAYFQAHSNTYAAPDILRNLYQSVLVYPQVVGISIGTRPDCLPDPILEILSELTRLTYVSVELGLQSIHDSSLKILNRNHDYAAFLAAFEKLKSRHIDTVIHLIMGIPGESQQMMFRSILEMNRLLPQGVKIHMLHVLKNTTLEKQYLRGTVPLFSQAEYVALVVELLERLDPGIVVHRLTGERNREIFVAPEWALDKAGTLRLIFQKMAQKDSWQGKHLTSNTLGK